MPELKTQEEHFEYMKHFARVSFYFARKWLVPRFPERKIGELIRDHTPILYHGLNYAPGIWNTDPDCRRIMDTADRLAELPPNEFEESMWHEIEELTAKRADLNYPTAVGVAAPASWNCGSLKYDPPNGKLPEGWVTFHIANAVGPHSIFDDPDYLAWCFLLLMKESEIRYGANVLFTSTWLNENTKFLHFFPQEWLDNMAPRPEDHPIPCWHFGWWGQLITARGTINPKMDKFVRENGHLKYACRSSHCSFENMRRHLKENILKS